MLIDTVVGMGAPVINSAFPIFSHFLLAFVLNSYLLLICISL